MTILPASFPGKAYLREVGEHLVRHEAQGDHFVEVHPQVARLDFYPDRGAGGRIHIGEVAADLAHVLRDRDLRDVVRDVQHLVDDRDRPDARQRILDETRDLGAVSPPSDSSRSIALTSCRLFFTRWFTSLRSISFSLSECSRSFSRRSRSETSQNIPITPDISPFSSRIGALTVLTQVSPPGPGHLSTKSVAVPEVITD